MTSFNDSGNPNMSNSHAPKTGFSTRAIHFGYDPAQHQGALVPPIYTSATYAFPDAAYGGRCFAGTEPGYFYTRVANPTLALLEARLASLEEGAGAVVFGSGMGAITATLWSMLEQGDEVLADLTLYGCTFSFLNHGLTRFGVTVRHVDMTEPDNVAQAMGPKTRVVYFESPANPNMRLVDIAAVSAIAHAGGARVVVDNTYCTPYLQQPLLLGADVSVHSMTKYLGGHGDLTAGAAIFADAELARRVRLFGLKDMTGAVMSAQDAHLVMRGLKTLALRMDRHCQSAQKVAELIQAHAATEVVHFPGLPSFCPARAGPAPDAPVWRHGGVRAEGWVAGGHPLHRCVAACHPRGQPGRRGNAGPASRQHDARHLHARRACGTRHQRRPGAPVGGPGRHRRRAG